MFKQYLINIFYFISIILSWLELFFWIDILKNINLKTRSFDGSVAAMIIILLVFDGIYSIYNYLFKKIKIHKLNLIGAIFFNIYILLWVIIKEYFNDHNYIKLILIPFSIYSVKWFIYKDKEVENK